MFETEKNEKKIEWGLKLPIHSEHTMLLKKQKINHVF